jgi:hypothetical protein
MPNRLEQRRKRVSGDLPIKESHMYAYGIPIVQPTAPTSEIMNAVRGETPSSTVPQPKQHAGRRPSRLLISEYMLGALILPLYSMVIALSDAPNAFALVSMLTTTAVFLLGIGNVDRILRSLLFRRGRPADDTAPWLRVPLTDSLVNLSTLNKFANSCQVREKGLKILQYVLRIAAYSALLPAGLSKDLKTLSKTTSIARRFFKLCRWIKHFDDFKDAKEEQRSYMKVLLWARIAANLGADWAEDLCSLERIGMLPKGTLSVEFMLFAEYCQLMLAIVEIIVTSVKAREAHYATEELMQQSGAKPASIIKQQRSLAMVRLELCKFVSDIGKAVYDCEFPFSHEGVFIGCALFSALVSTHKNMVKVLK